MKSVSDTFNFTFKIAPNIVNGWFFALFTKSYFKLNDGSYHRIGFKQENRLFLPQGSYRMYYYLEYRMFKIKFNFYEFVFDIDDDSMTSVLIKNKFYNQSLFLPYFV